MTLINNNFSVLPFYDSLELQDYKRMYSHGVIIPVISNISRLPPFQVIRGHIASDPNPIISKFDIVRFSDGFVFDALNEVLPAGFDIKKFSNEGYDVLRYSGRFLFPNLTLQPDLYYVVMSDGVNTWYSDLFRTVRDVELNERFLKIEYWDREGVFFSGGHIDYGEGFRNYIFVESVLNRPTYEYKEEVKDRDGYIFYEKQISEKTYNFSFFGVEHLCDAVRTIRLHDFVRIIDKGRIYNVDSILFDPVWQDQANIAEINVEFQTDTVVKKIGRGFVDTGNGDFSNDFSNDFDI